MTPFDHFSPAIIDRATRAEHDLVEDTITLHVGPDTVSYRRHANETGWAVVLDVFVNGSSWFTGVEASTRAREFWALALKKVRETHEWDRVEEQRARDAAIDRLTEIAGLPGGLTL